MPKASEGVLIRTDVATKIMLLERDKKDKFVIMDVDDRHLFIKNEWLQKIKEYVSRFKENTMFKPADNKNRF